MDPRFSIKHYPRKDTVYRIKSSYNFETIKARVYINRLKGHYEWVTAWGVHALIGVLIGSIAFLMGISEEHIADYHAEEAQHLIEHDHSLLKPYLFFVGYPLVFALIGCAMTIYYGPYANGSGVPEVMGMLNGVQGGGAVYISTLVTKVIGTVFAVLGGLCVGKEGPLVHIGAICGGLVPYIPFESFAPFRNDADKRLFMAAGCACGVAVAFGAPIGGTLMSYELSHPNTFWTFLMLWRTFFTAAMGVFTLGIL
jgi:H+/Cl- antiporter ClcA